MMATLSRLLIILITIHALEFIVAFSEKVVPLCPKSCNCTQKRQFLGIDCRMRHDSPDKLPGEITNMLNREGKRGYSRLSITSTTLTAFPRPVCEKIGLQELNFDSNRLSNLNRACLIDMNEVEEFSAGDNQITELPDGIFDGFRRVQQIRLMNNKIALIGAHVFLNLSYLRSVSLEGNQIGQLDIWPLFLAYQNPGRAIRHQFNLNENNISCFSNEINWPFFFGKPIKLTLNLAHNRIRHVTDLLFGWNLTANTLKRLVEAPVSKKKEPMMSLKLENNPLNCDCEDYELYRLDREITNRIYQDAVCKSPHDMRTRPVRTIPLNDFVCNVTNLCPIRCRCQYRPHNATLHACCSNANLAAFPNELPPIPPIKTRLLTEQPKYLIDISHNPSLRQITLTSYLSEVSVINAINCSIEIITTEAWYSLLTTQDMIVNLAHNQLQSIPQFIFYIQPQFQLLGLGYNQWACTCENKWMKEWLEKYNKRLLEPHSIYCSSPKRLQQKSLIDINDDDFCNDPVQQLRIYYSAIATSVVVGTTITVTVALFVTHRLRFKMFIRWKFHPFDRDECRNETMEYDVFLSFSSEDYQQDARSLIDVLEENGYKVCFHERDFEAGDTIENNMSRAIERSKRTLCLLSDNFILSAYCMREFEIAFHHNVTVLRKKRLIVLMKIPNPNALCRSAQRPPSEEHSDRHSSLGTDSLVQYLRQYTYIDYTADDWADRLLYALPIKGMLNNSSGANDERTPLI